MKKDWGDKMQVLPRGKAIFICSVVLVLIVSIGVGTMEASNTKAVVDGNTTFALDLYGRLKDEQGNLFFSPYSISVALAMTYAGARENTARQIAETLHFSLPSQRLHPAFASIEGSLKAIQKEGNVQLDVANSLWPQKDYGFLEEYLSLLKEYYGVSITPVDYAKAAEAARKMINAWVEEKTREKIKDIIQPGVLNALTRLTLVNAIYFKGNWMNQFEEEYTKDAPFHLLSGVSVQVPMMSQEETFGYAENETLQLLELPYAGGELSMLVILPREVDGLAKLQDELNRDNMEKWINALRKKDVLVFLPRFRATSQFRLDEALKLMGMTNAFDPEKADLSGMDGNPGWLYISAVLHKAFVDVNEEGTEAAASTAVAVGLASAPIPPVIFRADHPFVFLIRDNNTGSFLFMGRLVNPMS
jgi:serpin B